MSDALKPCPFCGGEAEYKEVPLLFEDGIVVRCTSCGVKTMARSISFDYKTAKDSVSSDWNRRTNDSQAITSVQAVELIKSICGKNECKTCVFREEPEKVKKCSNYNKCLLADYPMIWRTDQIRRQYEEKKQSRKQ